MSVDAPAAVTIRRATVTDVVDVAALERECYSDPWPASAFASLPENPVVFFVVAQRDSDGPLLGFAIVWQVLDEAELANLAVAKAARRQGVGAKLLDAVLENARRAATNRVYLEVRESNTAARRLYASRDFAEVGRRKKYYRTPVEDALILRCELE
jgi:ribosomal-protein-alanine N-acetyltransferase